MLKRRRTRLTLKPEAVVTTSTHGRARRLAAGGCDPQTIETLLAAEGFAKAREVMIESFATELRLIADQVKQERKARRELSGQWGKPFGQ